MTGKHVPAVLAEAELRARRLSAGTELRLPPGTILTPGARDYCAEHGLRIIESLAAPGGDPAEMPMDLSAEGRPGARYVDAVTGCPMTEKPEHMTHLSGNRLVPKTHPRIRLRGKLDSLEAALLCAQRQAQDGGRTETAAGLADCFALTQRLLGAEVKGSSPGAFSLLGMDPDRLRYVTHHVPEEFGIPHPAPHAGMGALCLTLNALRTQVRETELAAAEAYAGHREPTGDGILLALNRMSSAVYILFLREWKAGNG